MLEGNMYKYIITGDDVASGYNVARPLKTKKTSEFAFAVETIYKIGGVEIPKVFQCENGFWAQKWCDKSAWKTQFSSSKSSNKIQWPSRSFCGRL